LAQIIADDVKCPPRLQGYRIISLELANLVAGTKYRGEFEERLQYIIKEVTGDKAPPTILFIDEIHNLVGAGSAEGGLDAANILKLAFARGQLQVIGATTIAEGKERLCGIRLLGLDGTTTMTTMTTTTTTTTTTTMTTNYKRMITLLINLYINK